MKTYEVLTEESIKTLQHAAKWIATVDEQLPSDTAKEIVKGLQEIIKNVE